MASRQEVLRGLLEYVNERLGFRLSAANRGKLGVKLDTLHLRGRWPDLGAFRADLLAGGVEARETLVRAITVNHTYFFREQAQLDALVAEARLREGPTIWSAASSSGEEAYSLAILLLEAGLERFRIVASDINARVLDEMHRGVYAAPRLSGLPRHLRLKYFLREGEETWRVRPEIRRRLSVKRINLMEEPRFHRPFDFIVCRNVFIYFDDRTRAKVLASLLANLAPGGLLVLGLTEGLLTVPAELERVGQSIYRRVARG